MVAGDELTRPTGERYREPDEGLSYYRDSFDYGELFSRVLPAVRDGFAGDLTIRVSDWERDDWREGTLRVPDRGVLVVEGCFLFAAGNESLFDLSVWIDLPLEQVVERALRRPSDLERMGGPDALRARYAARYLPGQRLHLERDAPHRRAMLVVR